MEKKYGLTPIRRCKPIEEELITKKYAEVKHLLVVHRMDHIYWANIYLNKQFCWKTKEE